MLIARILGTVTLCRPHPTLVGARLRLATPLSLDNLSGQSTAEGDTLVVYDERSAGVGDLIAVSEGAEAAQPFLPDRKPVDAYAAAILDRVEIDPAAMQTINTK
jgi:ethanolamine utilization protein EutN